MKRINIVTGHFGSGKSEIAVNFALHLGVPATLVDLDIVNPYFRSLDAKNMLEECGVRVIAPQFANTNLDLPSLPSEIFSVFASESPVIFDVGGDEEGASALGRFHAYFEKEPYDMFLVVNTRRPDTATKEGILEMLASIQATSRLRVTGLINNTNLLEETTKEMVLQGEEIVKKAAKEAGIPFLFTAAKKELNVTNAFGLDLYIHMPFGGGK